MPWFLWLEQKVSIANCHLIHSRLDDYIPFCEYFIVPYLLWFAYIAGGSLFLLVASREDFYRTSAYLFIGMSISLFICTIYPNGQSMRVPVDPDGNIFMRIVNILYHADTDTNVFPSIHVFNSIGMHLSLIRNETFRKRRFLVLGSGTLMVLICASTVLLKQHSIIDVFGGIGLAVIMNVLVYKIDYRYLFHSDYQKKKEKTII